MPEFYEELLQLFINGARGKIAGAASPCLGCGLAGAILASLTHVSWRTPEQTGQCTQPRLGDHPMMPVTKDAPIAEFENVAAQYPVFKLETVDGQA